MRLLEARALPDGGFPSRSGEPFRSDATAWAILTLLSFDRHHPLLGSARARLAEAQSGNGSISISTNHADAYWPTALSVLAWNNSSLHETSRKRGIEFLLVAMGKHWKKRPDDPYGHDPSIAGWSWIADTHSWVEPTALAVCALRSNGFTQHQRVSDGVRLLMDRQLPKGGWNCGATVVFGTELHPDPESTGAALQALAGLVPKQDIQKSLDYLKDEMVHVQTPIALGWGLLGLHGWGEAPKESSDLIYQTLGRQERYGSYDTSSLALLLLPLVAGRGLLGFYDERP